MSDLKKRVKELERKDALTATMLRDLTLRINALESRQTAPEPVCEHCGGNGYIGSKKPGMASAPCPDCQPAPEPER